VGKQVNIRGEVKLIMLSSHHIH